MLKIIFTIFMLCFVSQLTYGGGRLQNGLQAEAAMDEESTPHYLYKVLSMEDWEESPALQSVKLPDADSEFIHFSRDDQLDRILSKYWAHIPKFVVLKIDTTKLPGKLVLEPNPGGIAKYYHLYNGFIPLDAVIGVEVKTTVK